MLQSSDQSVSVGEIAITVEGRITVIPVYTSSAYPAIGNTIIDTNCLTWLACSVSEKV